MKARKITFSNPVRRSVLLADDNVRKNTPGWLGQTLHSFYCLDFFRDFYKGIIANLMTEDPFTSEEREREKKKFKEHDA